MPTQAYRSSGRPEVTFAIERLIDKAARELGFDRIDLRRRNLVAPTRCPMPMPSARATTAANTKSTWTAPRLADWTAFRAPRRSAAARQAVGLGFANYVEVLDRLAQGARRPDRPAATAVEVVIGTQPAGQGHETSFAQVTADLLGVPFESVTSPWATPTWSAPAAAPIPAARCAMRARSSRLAAEDLIAKGKDADGSRRRRAAGAMPFEDGVFRALDSNHALTWSELASRPSGSTCRAS